MNMLLIDILNEVIRVLLYLLDTIFACLVITIENKIGNFFTQRSTQQHNTAITKRQVLKIMMSNWSLGHLYRILERVELGYIVFCMQYEYNDNSSCDPEYRRIGTN